MTSRGEHPPALGRLLDGAQLSVPLLLIDLLNGLDVDDAHLLLELVGLRVSQHTLLFVPTEAVCVQAVDLGAVLRQLCGQHHVGDLVKHELQGVNGDHMLARIILVHAREK